MGALGYEMQGSAEPGHHEERQLALDSYVMDSFLLFVGDAGAGEVVQGDGDRHGDAEEHALKDAEEHHAECGRGVDRHFSVARHRADVVQGHHLDTDGHHQGGEGGERDLLQDRDHQQRGDYYENAVQHGGVPAQGTGVHIRGTAHGHPGDRQSAERPGDDVGGSLTQQLPVEVGAAGPGAGAGASRGRPVHSHRAEQRLHAAHQGGGEHGGDEPEHRALGQSGQGMAAPGRQLDPGQGRPGEGRRRGGPGHGHERGRHSAQQLARAAGQPVPDQQEGERQRAHRDGGRMHVGQLGGQRPQIGQDGAVRAAAEDDVQLRDGEGDADPGEHAVHHGGADRERAARHSQTAEAELGESGEDGDAAGRPPAVAMDQVGGDHGEPRGGPADLERAATEPAGDESAHGRGDETGLQWGAGGQGDADGQGQGDQEDGDGHGKVGGRCGEAGPVVRRRTVR